MSTPNRAPTGQGYNSSSIDYFVVEGQRLQYLLMVLSLLPRKLSS